jgi:hypothetical protein
MALITSKAESMALMTEMLAEKLASFSVLFESELSEVAMKRVVRGGKIVRKVKVKRKGFKVLRVGNTVKFVRMTQQEKRVRRKAARKAWRTSKGSRKQKAKRTKIRSKVRMRQLYGK